MEYCLTVVVLLLVHGISGQLTDCDLRDDNDEPLKFDDWEVHSFGEILKTVADGTDLTGIQMTGVKFYSTDINECSDFLTVTTTDTHITITTKNFANWDRDGNLNGLCTLMFKFDPSNCDNMETTSVKLLVSYTIKDVNLMIPKFNEGSYTLNVPFPVPPGLSLTGALNQLIETTDEDFSTKTITYTLTGDIADYFQAEASAPSDKHFPMNLLTKKLINSQKEISLTVTATDDGSPPLFSTAQIIIRPNLENSIPPTPEFTQLVNTAKIDSKVNEVGQEVIQVELKEAFESVKISITPDEFFEADVDGKTVHIKLKAKLDIDTATFMTIEIRSVIDNGFQSASGATIVVLEFEDEDTTTTTETTVTPTGTPTTSSTESPPTPTGTPTTPTESPPTPTGTPTTTGSPSDPTASVPPTEEDPEDTNSGLVAATIVLGISTTVLLILNGYGCYKYIYKPRQARKTATA